MILSSGHQENVLKYEEIPLKVCSNSKWIQWAGTHRAKRQAPAETEQQHVPEGTLPVSISTFEIRISISSYHLQKEKKNLPGAPFEKSQCTQTFTTSAWVQVEKNFPLKRFHWKLPVKKCSSTIACMLLMRVSLSDAFAVIEHIPQRRGQSVFPRRFWAMWESIQVQMEIKTKQG